MPFIISLKAESDKNLVRSLIPCCLAKKGPFNEENLITVKQFCIELNKLKGVITNN